MMAKDFCKKTLVVVFALIFVLSGIKAANAAYPIMTVDMYPRQGDIYTNIYFQAMGYAMPQEISNGTHFIVNIFWDDVLIISADDAAKGYYETTFNISKISAVDKSPYIDLGVHQLYVQILQRSFGMEVRYTNTFLAFTINTFYPSTDSNWWQWWLNVPDSIKQQLIGPNGTQGKQGIQGVQGPQGLQGIQGIQGIAGVQGVKGDKGDQGVTGINGTNGLNGTQGPQGVQGLQGIKGDRGDKGDRGLDGINGSRGLQGEPGVQGEVGPQGPMGFNGTQGMQGEQGIVGADAPVLMVGVSMLLSVLTMTVFIWLYAKRPRAST